jgi:hypothetical protein
MYGTVFPTIVVSGTEHSSDAEVSSFPLVKLYFILGQFLQADTRDSIFTVLKANGSCASSYFCRKIIVHMNFFLTN